jgi:hypothetical protein
MEAHMKTGVRSTAGGWVAWALALGIVAHAGCERRSGALRLGVARSNLAAQSGESQMATWTCTDDPCPWGDELSNPALAWPAEAQPVDTRLGYTVSPAVYLPASSANGLTVTIDAGSASLHAGNPQDSSHPLLAFLEEGESYDVFGLDPDEVLSVQSDAPFSYHIAPTEPGDHPDAGTDDAGTPDAGTDDTGTPDAGTDDAGTPDAGTDDAGTPDAGTDDAGTPDAGPPPDAPPPPDGPASASQAITWTCTGRQCPFDPTLTRQALVWQVERGAITTYLGYTASATVYLFGSQANGADVWIETGTVDLEAGLPGDVWPRILTTLHAGEHFHVTGLGDGEVLSAQSDDPFTYRISLPPAGDPPGDPRGSGSPGNLMQATRSLWRCNDVPGCFSDDWTGAVIAWPSWSAYSSNDRPGNLSRSVFAWDATQLYPYMGTWADGCEVTGESGIARVIEWQRGSGQWRETWLYPGRSHVIHLVPPEDGALIEGYDASPGFSASFRNCTPQPLHP